MTDLIPLGGDVGKTKRDIRVAQLKLDGLAEFNDRAGEYLVDLVQRAQLRAAACPEAAPLITQFIGAYCLDAMSIQHSMYRRY